MILTGEEIKKRYREGKIVINPFIEMNITTNSYDLILGDKYLVYTTKILDPAKNNPYEIRKIPEDGLVLKKGDFALSYSKEIVGSNYYVPIIHAKSSIARLGLFIHVTADLIDIGSIGNITFQLFATMPVRIYSGMLIAQVSFWVPEGKITLYDGKYKGSSGVRPSEAYQDFRRGCK